MILSGKGGVGKSTVAFSICKQLSEKKKTVCLLDVDISGPTISHFITNYMGGTESLPTPSFNGKILEKK